MFWDGFNHTIIIENNILNISWNAGFSRSTIKVRSINTQGSIIITKGFRMFIHQRLLPTGAHKLFDKRYHHHLALFLRYNRGHIRRRLRLLFILPRMISRMINVSLQSQQKDHLVLQNKLLSSNSQIELLKIKPGQMQALKVFSY